MGKGRSVMWGWIPQFGHTVFFWSTLVAAVFGSIGIGAAFISAMVGYELSEWASRDANERISTAESSAKVEIEKARADADVKIGIAQADIEKARAETAQARTEQERLKALMAWRRLTPEQYGSLQWSLKGKNFVLWTGFVGNDPEAAVFRGDLDKALSDAGLRTKFFSGWERGVGVQLTHVPGPEFDALASAFKAAGIPFEVRSPDPGTNPENPGTGLGILVGTKPPPF